MEKPNQIVKEKLLEVELQKKYENLSDQELELKRNNLDYAINEMIQEIKDKRDVASLLETERGVVESIQRKRRWKEYKK
jgi:hypothetical protein